MIEYIKKMEAAADYHRKMERDELLSKQQILADIYFGNQYGTDHSIITTARDLGEFEERDKINERGTKIR
jgi:hypothetical protein